VPHFWGIQFNVLIGFPLLVALAAASEPKGIFLSIFCALGAASYAIYAIHEPLHGLISAMLTKLSLPTGLLGDFILITSIVPICVIMDKVYDTPVRKYLTSKLLRRPGSMRTPEAENVATS
jgi:peptidoglycan/LPS O-acetylase OafA/YrhL